MKDSINLPRRLILRFILQRQMTWCPLLFVFVKKAEYIYLLFDEEYEHCADYYQSQKESYIACFQQEYDILRLFTYKRQCEHDSFK